VAHTSILRPPDKTTANPQLDSLSNADFLLANSTATNWLFAQALFLLLFLRCFFRWRSSVLKLKPRLRQNSRGRMPLVANSATNCWTSARVRRVPAVAFCSPFIPHFSTDSASRTGVLVERSLSSVSVRANTRLKD
jgi:hypothetical protein